MKIKFPKQTFLAAMAIPDGPVGAGLFWEYGPGPIPRPRPRLLV